MLTVFSFFFLISLYPYSFLPFHCNIAYLCLLSSLDKSYKNSIWFLPQEVTPVRGFLDGIVIFQCLDLCSYFSYLFLLFFAPFSSCSYFLTWTHSSPLQKLSPPVQILKAIKCTERTVQCFIIQLQVTFIPPWFLLFSMSYLTVYVCFKLNYNICVEKCMK